MEVLSNVWVAWCAAVFFGMVIGFLTVCMHLLRRERHDWQQATLAALKMSMAHEALSTACLQIASEVWTEHEGAE